MKVFVLSAQKGGKGKSLLTALITQLKAEFETQLKEEAELNVKIQENLAKIKI